MTSRTSATIAISVNAADYYCCVRFALWMLQHRGSNQVKCSFALTKTGSQRCASLVLIAGEALSG